jgi:dihydroorotate dehydrogenase
VGRFGDQLKPWLWLPASMSHALSSPVLQALGTFVGPKVPTWQPLDWRGLRFSNPLGTSGGVDKNGQFVNGFWALGAGFVEVGTVTPQPQTANPGPVLSRDLLHRALWNKMGFPNQGAQATAERLEKLSRPRPTPLFVNIGKNRTTDNAVAAGDYISCIQTLRSVADVFVVNVSSPNTSGLRDLLKPAHLAAFLEPIIKAAAPLPVLLKLSPDMDDDSFRSALDTSLDSGVAGWVLTNTTLARQPGMRLSAEGGVSGAPLRERSRLLLEVAVQHLGSRRGDRLLVSAGGVMSPEEVFARLDIGADLVQVYTALVFDGPWFFRKVAAAATRD